jgi:hypothetical protein
LGGAGELLNHGEVELSGLAGTACLVSIEGVTPKRVFHQQRDCPNHQQYVDGASAELKHDCKHPDHDPDEEESPKHQ